MKPYITRIQAKGIYGLFNIDYEFHDGVNVIYALNGYGKTTLIHILSNILNHDWSQFYKIEFKSIRVTFSNNEEYYLSKLESRQVGSHFHHKINVKYTKDISKKKPIRKHLVDGKQEFCTLNQNVVKTGTENQIEEDTPLHRAAYFPAFRSALDSYSAMNNDPEIKNARSILPENFGLFPEDQTAFARKFLNQFVPKLDYNSIELFEKAFKENFDQAKSDVVTFENYQFGNILNRLAKFTTYENGHSVSLRELYNEIQSMVTDSLEKDNFPVNVKTQEIVSLMENVDEDNELQNSILYRDALVYRELLQEIIAFREKADNKFNIFIESVNEFLALTSKSIERDPDDPSQVQLCDHGHQRDLSTLSSGERQILSMVYFASWLSDQEVILIDEPEISLHVDWQRRLLPMLEKQLSGKQLIACTHSPIILRPYQEDSRELIPEFELPDEPEKILEPA